MKATLWDGKKRLEGRLTLGVDSLSFEIDDFEKSKLKLSINYAQIDHVKYHKLFDIEVNGLELTYEGAKQSVFVVERAEELMAVLRKLSPSEKIKI